MILAIDPGQRGGAAVVLDAERRIIAAFAWKRHGTVNPSLRLLWSTSRDPRGRLGGIFTGYRLGVSVGNVLRSAGISSWRLVVEDTFVGRSPKVAITSARWTGAFVGPLEDGALADGIVYSRADEWRAEAFGIRRATKRPIAKKATLDRLPASTRAEVDRLAEGLGGIEHIVDAVGIGLWGSGLRYRSALLPVG